MSNDQYYRLEESWTSEQWPKAMDEETIAELNEVAPNGFHYALCSTNDGEDRVELYEYAGEFNPLNTDDWRNYEDR